MVPKLVPVKNWRKSWRWISVWVMGLQGAAATSWLMVPDDVRSSVPAEWLAVAAVVLTMIGIPGRLIDQGGNDD